MIITLIYGGLGNQMFQYALGRKLSLKRGTELKLDVHWFKTEMTGTSPQGVLYESRGDTGLRKNILTLLKRSRC